jgi:glycosyltransferase involved in cell wall biosynthesis
MSSTAAIVSGAAATASFRDDDPSRVSLGQRAAERAKLLKLLKLRLKEWLAFDLPLFHKTAGLLGYVVARLLRAAGHTRRSFSLLSKLHRADFLQLTNSFAEKVAREAAAHAASGRDHPLLGVYKAHVEQQSPSARTAKFFDDPTRLLGPMAMVLKSASADEKGVLLLQYSYTFPLFAKRFDVEKIAARYHIVLEPDWSGYCDLNILSYCQFRFPVFVQAFEPRDAGFITRLRSNLVVVPTSTNWWVDHRLFRPLPGTKKDFDLVMVAGWGEYKRHHRFFRALGRLRRSGCRLRVLLLGYPISFTKEEIRRQAAFHGVADQCEIHEWVPYEQVNEFVNRAKVNVIWSRKEGVNRAIIEGMFAGVPCVVREGFNYGFRYPYINAQTGCFASERELPAKLLWMVERWQEFAPRQWVESHMPAQRATELLSEAIGRMATARGERWTGGLAVKVNKLHNMEYWDPADHARFEPDYSFLRTTLQVQLNEARCH